MPKRGQVTPGTTQRTTTLHRAPLVVPVSGPPVRSGAVAVRAGKVIAVGRHKELTLAYPRHQETRWPGMIVAGLVDAHARLDRAPDLLAAVRTRLRHGIVALADVVRDPEAPGLPAGSGLGGIAYLEVRCPDEETWERTGRDRLITAIRELDRPVGIAPNTADHGVLEDLAVLARTFGLRMHAELTPHRLATLDETRALGPHTHLANTGRLDTGERKLLRLYGTPVALSPLADPEDAAALIEDGNPIALHTLPDRPDLLATARAFLANRPDELRARLLVEAATTGGARALGLADGQGRIGSLGPGGRADFAVFAVERPGRKPYTALLHEGPGNCVATVTGGRVRWRAA
jgi:cytosine/adenosine deaminase-related metal-dependent hydrolase